MGAKPGFGATHRKPRGFKRLSPEHHAKLRRLVIARGIKPTATLLRSNHETIRVLLDTVGPGVRHWVADRIAGAIDGIG
jgi:hypothetical protein